MAAEVLTERQWLLKLASLLEGEGMEAGPVMFSEEFARMLAERLRAIAGAEWIRTKPEVTYDVGPGPGDADECKPIEENVFGCRLCRGPVDRFAHAFQCRDCGARVEGMDHAG